MRSTFEELRQAIREAIESDAWRRVDRDNYERVDGKAKVRRWAVDYPFGWNLYVMTYDDGVMHYEGSYDDMSKAAEAARKILDGY